MLKQVSQTDAPSKSAKDAEFVHWVLGFVDSPRIQPCSKLDFAHPPVPYSVLC